MTSITRVLTLALAVTGALAAPLHAQEIERKGFFFGVGLGGGGGKLYAEGESSDRLTGLSGHLRAGAALSPTVLLGGESNGWYRSESGLDETIGGLMVTAYVYPARNFFVKVGSGLMTYRADDGIDDLTTVNLGSQVGIGYDIRLGRKTALTLVANYLFGFNGDVEFSGLDTGVRARPDLLQIGAAFSLY